MLYYYHPLSYPWICKFQNSFQRRMAEAELANNSGDSPQVNGGAPLGDEDDRKLFVGGLPQDATQVIESKFLSWCQKLRFSDVWKKKVL